MYDRILVPTDGSDGVRRAVDQAIRLADAHGATVDAIYVVNNAGLGLPMESTWEGIDGMLREDAAEAVAAVERRAAERGVDAEGHVVDGAPHREIVRFAEREGCDLVVMGTHGRGGIDRLLLGSVAERVVRASNVPVMTVRVDGEGGDPATATEAEAETETKTKVADAEADAADETASEGSA